MRGLALAFSVAIALVACGNSGSDDGSGGGGAGGTTSTGGSGATGGTTGSGGSTASGGGGTGGSGGSGGSGVNPRCEPLCQKLVDAGCSGGPTLDGCLVTCKALTSAAVCDDTATDYFDCVDSVDVQCNGQGDPYAPGCGDEWLIAIGCAVNENPNPAIEAPCDSYCDSVVAAACPNNGTKDECYTNCLWVGATGTGCDDEWGTFLTCANSATFTCILGYAAAQGCGPDFQAYTNCINAAGGG